jgi:hypothetical protein
MAWGSEALGGIVPGGLRHPVVLDDLVAIAYKASTFDNVQKVAKREKPLLDKDLTASIQVNS